MNNTTKLILTALKYLLKEQLKLKLKRMNVKDQEEIKRLSYLLKEIEKEIISI